jgi:predicted enzyme related to lactoylglutathione lyase
METKKSCPVVYFEIGCEDKTETTSFYTNVFGWTPTESQYANKINTNSEKGIQGHIVALGHEPHQFVNIYIQVDDINHYIAEVEKAGGKKLLGPIPLPENQQFAWVTDPAGNTIGLITA